MKVQLKRDPKLHPVAWLFLVLIVLGLAFGLTVLFGWLAQLVLAAFGVDAPLWACALGFWLLCIIFRREGK